MNLQECRQKFGEKHEYSWVEEHGMQKNFYKAIASYLTSLWMKNHTSFKFIVSTRPKSFLNTCKVSLGELVHLVDDTSKKQNIWI